MVALRSVWAGTVYRLPKPGRETTGWNAILVDDMAGTVQRWDGRVDLRCTAGFVTLSGHRVAIFVR